MSCSRHPDVAESFTCPRCGSFGCAECERRGELNAAPMCPACWARYAAAAQTAARGGTGLQTAGLVLGVVSIIPCCPIAIVSFVLNVAAIILAKEPPARDVRWRPVLGLVLTVVWAFAQVALYYVFQSAAAR